MSFQDDLKQLSEKVKQYRDEARVQIHLAREDVKDEWDDLEKIGSAFAASSTGSYTMQKMRQKKLARPPTGLAKT